MHINWRCARRIADGCSPFSRLVGNTGVSHRRKEAVSMHRFLAKFTRRKQILACFRGSRMRQRHARYRTALMRKKNDPMRYYRIRVNAATDCVDYAKCRYSSHEIYSAATSHSAVVWRSHFAQGLHEKERKIPVVRVYAHFNPFHVAPPKTCQSNLVLDCPSSRRT